MLESLTLSVQERMCVCVQRARKKPRPLLFEQFERENRSH